MLNILGKKLLIFFLLLFLYGVPRNICVYIRFHETFFFFFKLKSNSSNTGGARPTMSKLGNSGLGTVQEEVVTHHPQAQQSVISTALLLSLVKEAAFARDVANVFIH